jgi:hypothetical protein
VTYGEEVFSVLVSKRFKCDYDICFAVVVKADNVSYEFIMGISAFDETFLQSLEKALLLMAGTQSVEIAHSRLCRIYVSGAIGRPRELSKATNTGYIDPPPGVVIKRLQVPGRQGIGGTLRGTVRLKSYSGDKLQCMNDGGDNLSTLVTLLREERHREYKRSESWDALKAAIAKTAMAMANTQDGGVIVVGVRRESTGGYSAVGIESRHRETYDEDVVRDYANRFAEPRISIRLTDFQVEGRDFLALEVPESEVMPVICTRDGDANIRAGALYIRPLGKAETREPRTGFEIRELLDTAVRKEMQRELRRLQGYGLLYPLVPLVQDDRQKFDAQLRGLVD